MKTIRFGRVQLRIMQFLWKAGQSSAREITEALNAQEAIAHSTVQTLLRGLEDKGAVGHHREERTFIFKPLVQADQAKRSATRDFVDGLFQGSPTGLVAYLLKNEKISQEELKDLRELIHSVEDSTDDINDKR